MHIERNTSFSPRLPKYLNFIEENIERHVLCLFMHSRFPLNPTLIQISLSSSQ